jgi:hypothetical protein
VPLYYYTAYAYPNAYGDSACTAKVGYDIFRNSSGCAVRYVAETATTMRIPTIVNTEIAAS